MQMNWVGCWALFMKEVRRFYSVAVQTIFAPVVASLLYLLIFGQVIEARMDVYTGLSYSQFIIPGLVMMTILQNAFSNTSSSLIQSKMHGNLTFVMLSPISPLELYLAFVGHPSSVDWLLDWGFSLWVFGGSILYGNRRCGFCYSLF